MIDTFIGKTLAEKYRIDSVMRETELGKIYHGRHLLMDKPVAVKILSPASSADEKIVRRFSSEARNVSSISHPGILNVTDFGTAPEGAVYIVFEDADGETLKSAIERGGVFEPARAVRVAKQIAAALSAAHRKGVVHGNLNSENILLGADDAVKILDLGAVKLDAVAAADDELSFPKIEYLAPEQCAADGEADERSDIYSLGVVLYEMLTGETPFKAENTSELMLKQTQEPPPPLAAFRQDLPGGVEPLILQTLAKNPEMRHQTAAELFDDLNRVERTFAASENQAVAAAPASGNNVWKTAFVVLAGIALLSATLIWATSSKQTNPTTLQADSNSQPVQPINPATGMNEQGLATIVPMTQEMLSNSNMTLTAPENLGGGSDGNPYWQSGRVPPGAPLPVQQGGQFVDPNNPESPFMRDAPQGGQIIQGEDGKMYYIVPNTPDANVKASPSPKTAKSPNANVVTPTVEPNETTKPQTTPTPEVKATPAKTPATKPTPQPKNSPAQTRQAQSGKTQDS
ncbi:MAG TPA: serine/threonine-protein kinase [Pyrinomonadaceae bacterium]|jgi:serine/threonine protein kinase